MGAWQTAQSSILNLSILLSLLCTLGFTASFFRQVCPTTPLNKLIWSEMLLIGLTAALLMLTTDLQFNQLIYALIAVCTLSILLIAFYHWRHGYRPARLFTLALLVFCAAFCSALPMYFGYWQVQSEWLASAV